MAGTVTAALQWGPGANCCTGGMGLVVGLDMIRTRGKDPGNPAAREAWYDRKDLVFTLSLAMNCGVSRRRW